MKKYIYFPWQINIYKTFQCMCLSVRLSVCMYSMSYLFIMSIPTYKGTSLKRITHVAMEILFYSKPNSCPYHLKSNCNFSFLHYWSLLAWLKGTGETYRQPKIWDVQQMKPWYEDKNIAWNLTMPKPKTQNLHRNNTQVHRPSCSHLLKLQ